MLPGEEPVTVAGESLSLAAAVSNPAELSEMAVSGCSVGGLGAAVDGNSTEPIQSQVSTVSTDTRLIQTLRYYGKFRESRRKAHISSLKLIHSIWTPVDTDNGHFSAVSRVTNLKVTKLR